MVRMVKWVGLFVAVATAAAQPPEPVQERRPVVTIVGASVSAGFEDLFTDGKQERNGTIRLQRALRNVWPRGVLHVRDRSDVQVFLDPARHGESQVKRAERDRPDLLIGVDFLFWFGAGYVRGPDRREARLERQRQGLALLGRLDCPMILGDYPDVTGANPKMIAPAQIPTDEERRALNAGLREWAKARPNVLVFPLAAWVAEAKRAGTVVELAGREVRIGSERLLQTDRLHATRLGVTLLAHRLAGEVDRVLPDDHPLRAGRATLDELLRRSGADIDLPDSAHTGRELQEQTGK